MMEEQLELRFISQSQPGELNPNWKGGISKNNYHYKKLQVQRYPEKIKARDKVYRAVKSGKLEKQPCEVCGDPKSEAHHYKGYKFPLDVQWLCKKHHIAEEKKTINNNFN